LRRPHLYERVRGKLLGFTDRFNGVPEDFPIACEKYLLQLLAFSTDSLSAYQQREISISTILKGIS
jgi:hypothetical protein